MPGGRAAIAARESWPQDEMKSVCGIEVTGVYVCTSAGTSYLPRAAGPTTEDKVRCGAT